MNVLIAEDDRITRMMEQRFLCEWGHTIHTVVDGQEAYNFLTQEQLPTPLIILLDWVMPGRDGLAVLQALQDCSHVLGIYVIMVTSKSHGEEIAVALENGADDYLRKPFHPRELEARINVGVRTIQNEARLVEQNKLLDHFGREMHQLAEERAQQLVHADRMATLGVMSAGIAHEINNSSSFISGNVQTLARIWDRLLKSIDQMLQTKPDALPDRQLYEFVLDEVPGMLDGMRQGVSRIHSIVKGLSDYSRDDRGDMAPIDLHKCVDNALVICSNKTKRIKHVQIHPGPVSGRIDGIGNQIEQVLVNLVGNAADALEHVADGRIDIIIEQAGSVAQIRVRDNGPGVSPGAMDRIFDPFFTTKGVGKGTGLGLAICAKIIAQHHGQLYLDQTCENGVCFVIELPVQEWEALA